ncbi:MAG: hypothetical protein SFV19_05840 [Rhodospirillaceae bacterium]|nr:hypothetical protein [Rhodospirillaceae bacterium]
MRALLTVLLGAVIASTTAAQDGKGKIIDEGKLTISGRPGFARTEEFSIFQRADGGFTVRSTITAEDGSYTANGRWNFDATWRAIDAAGQGDAKGVKRRIEMWRESTPSGTVVKISRRATLADDEPRNETFSAPCDAECLMDMAPAALPMSVMTRRYDAGRGGEQAFRWVGASLTDDQVLLGGTATLWLNRMQKVAGSDIAHWRFREDLPGANPGENTQMHMHLWTDAAGSLRKFGVGRTDKPTTIGVRESDAELSAQMSAE